MLFNDDSFYSKTRRAVEKDRNNLIDFHFDHHDEIASFLKSHFHNVNKIKNKTELIEH